MMRGGPEGLRQLYRNGAGPGWASKQAWRVEDSGRWGSTETAEPAQLAGAKLNTKILARPPPMCTGSEAGFVLVVSRAAHAHAPPPPPLQSPAAHNAPTLPHASTPACRMPHARPVPLSSAVPLLHQVRQQGGNSTPLRSAYLLRAVLAACHARPMCHTLSIHWLRAICWLRPCWLCASCWLRAIHWVHTELDLAQLQPLAVGPVPAVHHAGSGH